MHGLNGRVLLVDLGTGKFRDLQVNESTWRKYLGGSGLAAHWFSKNADPEVDPFGPENPLMVLCGPLAASGLPGASRFSICAKSPLTGLWGESSCGGHFAPELVGAGYDGIIVTGSADAPVVLVLDEGQARLEPAGGLWGKDTYTTIDELK